MNAPASYRALIVDDERLARRHLRELLAEHPEIKVIGEAGSVADAQKEFSRLKPDLIFLDIQMPHADGFDLLPRLDPLPKIVFVTAHDEFAVRAFEVNAVDYLLKPINPVRMAVTLGRLAAGEPVSGHPSAEHPLQQEDSVFLHSDRQLRMVAVNQITHIVAEENYSHVHLLDSSVVLVLQNMKNWENRLPASVFSRIHRSLLVNLRHVREVDVHSRDKALLHLKGHADPIPLHRSAIPRLHHAMREVGT